MQIVPSSAIVSTYVASFPTFLNCQPQEGTSQASCPRAPRITTAGEVSTFTIYSRDFFGNYWSQDPGLTLAVDVSGAAQTTGNVSDSGDGSYIVTIKMSLSGQYYISVHDITNMTAGATGGSISGSPFGFYTVPSTISLSHSTAVGIALTYGEAGEDMTFTIESRDDFANSRIHGLYDAGRNEFQGEFFKSNIDMRTKEHPWISAISSLRVVDSLAGKYAVILQVTASGRYDLNIFHRDLTSFAGVRFEISSSPFSPQVEPVCTRVYEPHISTASFDLLCRLSIVGGKQSIHLRALYLSYLRLAHSQGRLSLDKDALRKQLASQRLLSTQASCYGVATISRLLKIVGLFCRI